MKNVFTNEGKDMKVKIALKSYQNAIRLQVHWITCIGIRLLYTSCYKDMLPYVFKQKVKQMTLCVC